MLESNISVFYQQKWQWQSYTYLGYLGSIVLKSVNHIFVAATQGAKAKAVFASVTDVFWQCWKLRNCQKALFFVACTLKSYTPIISNLVYFFTFYHLHPNLMFSSRAGACPYGLSANKWQTLKSTLAYKTKVQLITAISFVL